MAKYNLEEMQRAERKEREKRGDGWAPRWYRAVPDLKLLPGEYRWGWGWGWGWGGAILGHIFLVFLGGRA